MGPSLSSVLLADGQLWHHLGPQEVRGGFGEVSTQGLRPGKPLGRACGCPLPSHLQPPDIGERPSPSLGNRPNCCQTPRSAEPGPIPVAGGPRATAYLHPPVLLGVAVSLPPADWSEEVEGRQRAGLLLPFWVVGWGKRDEGAETEK